MLYLPVRHGGGGFEVLESRRNDWADEPRPRVSREPPQGERSSRPRLVSGLSTVHVLQDSSLQQLRISNLCQSREDLGEI